MKLARFDWRYLLEDTMIPGLSLLAAVMIFGAGIWYHDKHQDNFETFSVNQEAIHDDYDALVHRRRLLERYYRRYSEFQLLGFVGRESRLDWIETIRSAARGLDLPNVTYSLEPQLEVIMPAELVSTEASIKVYLSRLDIELGLVHELDLLRFVDRLKLEAPGLMKVDACDMERQGSFDQELVADANINANCSLLIFSVLTSDISAEEVGS